MKPLLLVGTLCIVVALAMPTASAAPRIVFAIHQDLADCTGGQQCDGGRTLDCAVDPVTCNGPPDPW